MIGNGAVEKLATKPVGSAKRIIDQKGLQMVAVLVIARCSRCTLLLVGRLGHLTCLELLVPKYKLAAHGPKTNSKILQLWQFSA